MLGVMRDTLDNDGGSIRGDEDFFSVASIMPFVAYSGVSEGRLDGSNHESLIIPLMPKDVTPWFTAFRAYSIRRYQSRISKKRFPTKHTYLHELPTSYLSTLTH